MRIRVKDVLDMLASGAATRGLALGVWGRAINASLVFLQPLARALHAKSHPVAARPDGGASGPLILTASREKVSPVQFPAAEIRPL
jgi:hypothetical protein